MLKLFIEILNSGYKFSFLFWLFSIFFVSFALLLSIKELNRYKALKESEMRLRNSQSILLSQIRRLKDDLKVVNWQRSFAKDSRVITFSIDLRDLNKSLREIEDIILHNDTFLIINELKFTKINENPVLYVNGELIKFY